jgi:alpha-galactosidase
MITRRSFLSRTAATGLIAGSSALATTGGGSAHESTYIDLIRTPDAVTAFSGLDDRITLEPSRQRFAGKDVVVTASLHENHCAISLSAPTTALTHVHIRWQTRVSATLAFLGDHWERSYGDLAWRGMTPERAMPWYFATYDENALHCYGVKTQPSALCFWQVDPEGVSLWLDVSNGGNGVRLGARELDAATVLTRRGTPGESPIPALRAFCKQMCPKPVLPKGAVYGGNDWYTAYGKNSQEMLLRIADMIAELSPTKGTVHLPSLIWVGKNILRAFRVWRRTPSRYANAASGLESGFVRSKPGQESTNAFCFPPSAMANVRSDTLNSRSIPRFRKPWNS